LRHRPRNQRRAPRPLHVAALPPVLVCHPERSRPRLCANGAVEGSAVVLLSNRRLSIWQPARKAWSTLVATSIKTDPVRLGILLSGRGSNFLAIDRSIREGRLPGVEIAVVISNVADASGLAAARELGLEHALFVSKGRPRADHDADVLACLRSN